MQANLAIPLTLDLPQEDYCHVTCEALMHDHIPRVRGRGLSENRHLLDPLQRARARAEFFSLTCAGVKLLTNDVC